ncbi:Bcr/CflA family multidrug efflux MFS transporter [Allomuricauda sp. NBRC 101325]|uniref:Bcr/CflA family multidrug efflux MFS transporter n=1 Tax=Allomuricauda sp. NBRC 101325 TaxID=1113758 RepID=UPI0024A42907|nr:Bcr/CflA family multidrug efflux MFS transporter [Muricauda sp. NBRC 101325]GLU45134.1 Bcr/CflA family drug resistance efflux transporter [Muricauda sp. NBRC 101325]
MKSISANIESQDKTGSKYLLVILGALMAITSLSTDIYLPAMPQMGLDLKGDIELTITGFLIGFSIAQIVWGPISDKYGRKTPLVLGMVLFIIGSIGCAMSETIVQIMIWRVVQAFGACTGPMLSRAMVRDLFGRTKSAEMLSTLMILMAIAPIVGPLFGGQLLKFSSWHSIFWALSVIGVLMLLSTFILKETLPQERRADTSLREAFKKYKILLAHSSFMKYTLCVTFYYVGAYAFIAGSPLVYIEHFGVAPQNYGWLFAVNIVGIMGFSFVNRILIRRFNLDKLLRYATFIAMIAGIVLLIDAKIELGGIYGVAIPIFFYFSMNGIIAANSTAGALHDVPEMAGAASALLGSLQYGSGILSSLILATLADSTPWTMSVIIAFFGIAAAFMMFINLRFPYTLKLGKS